MPAAAVRSHAGAPSGSPADLSGPPDRGTATQRPAPGRPRDPQVDAAIVEATLQLLADCGYGGVTMEAVAARAGVGKATLYRRCAGKAELVVEALKSVVETAPEMPGASVEQELVTLLDTLRRSSSSSLSGRIFPQLLAASAEPELMALYREQVITPRRTRFQSVLARGVEQGLLRADVDLEYAYDLMVGPVIYRNLVRTDAPPAGDFPARVVADVLRALAPPDGEPSSRLAPPASEEP